MKRNFLLLILCCFITTVFAQQKTTIGLTTEGSWFVPHELDSQFPTKNGFGAGLGVFVSQPLVDWLSVDIGLMYRYKEMKQHYSYIVTDWEHSRIDVTDGDDKFPMHYFVVPLNLRFNVTRDFFLKTGFESSWLAKYDVINEKPEFDWSIGFGSSKHKLGWSLSYLRGFKDQSLGNKTPESNGRYKAASFRNNTLQLSLSYPLWQKN